MKKPTEKPLTGLTAAEVRKRQAAGLTNNFTAKASNSNWEIIKRNVFNIFNLLNFAIAAALIAVGAWTNLVFVAVIAINITSGILTEWRAKKMIEKLNLLSREKVAVIRSGREKAIDSEEIVLGDLIKISAGQQVPSDAIVKTGIAEVNEAMLTGESDLVIKEFGSALLSGSYLASGEILAEVSHVGADNYAARLMIEAKTHKPINSEILNSLNRVASLTSKIIVPFGLALFLEALLIKNLPLKNAVITTSTPLLGMLPKGIALLTITSLLTAVIKLGMRKILVQEMYSVETLARVDTLCLDKTGTITEGKMKVESVSYLSPKLKDKEIDEIIAAYITASGDKNPTAKAIREQYSQTKTKFTTADIIPFSSDRKWGAVEIESVGTVVVGAPDVLFASPIKEAQAAQATGARVLAVAVSSQKIDNHDIKLPSKMRKLAAISISDPIRSGAPETLDYLRSQEVDLKIISGDNPMTVSKIAQKAGFENYESFVDCSKMTDGELRKIAVKTAIFGRVSPQQKRLIIETLKKSGRTVAMTGDGVNDILALREADCSIVMAEGDAATRQIANLVLLKSDFNDMPEILFEGRRVVNNIARIAPIFFIKTIYSFVIAIICILSVGLGPEAMMIFPFIPIQITLIDQFIEGFTPFFLSFERNNRPVKKNFLRTSLMMALPSAIMVIFSVLFTRIAGNLSGWTMGEINTLNYYLLGTISLFSVVRACWPLNWFRGGLLLLSAGGFYATAILFRDLIEVEVLSARVVPVFAVLSLIFAVIFAITSWLHYQKNNVKIKALAR